jgi:hypothetical protein
MVPAFRGGHDSYRIRFCCRYDGLDRLDRGGGSRRGCTQGTPVNAAGSHQTAQIISPGLRRRNCRNLQRRFVARMVCPGLAMTVFNFIAIAALVIVIVWAVGNHFPLGKL